jgi:hypothetical protein
VAIDAVADALPDAFPHHVAGPMIAHARNWMTLPAGQVDAGLVGSS